MSVTATANAIGGSYAVSATANGIANSASFSLTNKWVPIFSVARRPSCMEQPRPRFRASSATARRIPRDRLWRSRLTRSLRRPRSIVPATSPPRSIQRPWASPPVRIPSRYAFAGNSAFASAADASTQVTVTPAPLTITAGGVSRVYGASDPTLGVTYSGFVNNETSSVLGGTLSVVDSDAAPTTAVGTTPA